MARCGASGGFAVLAGLARWSRSAARPWRTYTLNTLLSGGEFELPRSRRAVNSLAARRHEQPDPDAATPLPPALLRDAAHCERWAVVA